MDTPDFETDLLAPIPIDCLRQHITRKSELVNPGSFDQATGWDVEFSFLERTTREDPRYSKETKISSLEINKPKNRYMNVLAADDTIVELPPTGAEGECSGPGYINANWISGPFRPRSYIACQGPLSETINDFWLMIWNENVSTIVMLTREEEKDTAKCERYWPNMGELVSTLFQITFLNQEDDRYNVIRKRTLRLKHLGTNTERIVTHFQYTEWPDYGVPGSPFAFMQLVHDVDQTTQNQNSPLCVHCSAGIGRTGTFFSVHILMHKIRDWYQQKTPGVPSINIISTVLQLREQRAGMVQTKGQFVFIYSAILFEYEHLKKEIDLGRSISIADMEEDNQTQLRAARRLKTSRNNNIPPSLGDSNGEK